MVMAPLLPQNSLVGGVCPKPRSRSRKRRLSASLVPSERAYFSACWVLRHTAGLSLTSQLQEAPSKRNRYTLVDLRLLRSAAQSLSVKPYGSLRRSGS